MMEAHWRAHVPENLSSLHRSHDKQPEEALSARSGTRKKLENRGKVTETVEGPPTPLELPAQEPW